MNSVIVKNNDLYIKEIVGQRDFGRNYTSSYASICNRFGPPYIEFSLVSKNGNKEAVKVYYEFGYTIKNYVEMIESEYYIKFLVNKSNVYCGWKVTDNLIKNLDVKEFNSALQWCRSRMNY